jgi:hypothetical protein
LCTKKEATFLFHGKKYYFLKPIFMLICWMVSFVSVRSQPKASMRTKLPNGDFLTFAVWPGKSDPMAEVITVQIRHLSGDRWETVGRLVAYRTADGNYSQLPERREQKQDDGNSTLEI